MIIMPIVTSMAAKCHNLLVFSAKVDYASKGLYLKGKEYQASYQERPKSQKTISGSLQLFPLW